MLLGLPATPVIAAGRAVVATWWPVIYGRPAVIHRLLHVRWRRLVIDRWRGGIHRLWLVIHRLLLHIHRSIMAGDHRANYGCADNRTQYGRATPTATMGGGLAGYSSAPISKAILGILRIMVFPRLAPALVVCNQ